MKIHYKIKSENYEFYATITEIENHEYRIKFGGARQCINVSIYKDSNESSLANLNGVSYDLECSIDKNLLAGDGTADKDGEGRGEICLLFGEAFGLNKGDGAAELFPDVLSPLIDRLLISACFSSFTSCTLCCCFSSILHWTSITKAFNLICNS